MPAFDQLKSNLTKHIELTDEEFDSIRSYFRFKTFHKKDILLRPGEVCRFEAFVISGLLRVYFLDSSGQDHTLYFADKNWWVTDIESYIHQSPATLCIDTLEESKLLFIQKEDKDQLYSEHPKLEKLFLKMTQRRAVALQRRMVNFLSKNADERYVIFLNSYPDIAKRLTNKQIASYLGISHEFLSKIRRKLSKNV